MPSSPTAAPAAAPVVARTPNQIADDNAAAAKNAAADANNAGAPASGSSPLLVTSGPSRTQYSTNVSDLSVANNNTKSGIVNAALYYGNPAGTPTFDANGKPIPAANASTTGATGAKPDASAGNAGAAPSGGAPAAKPASTAVNTVNNPDGSSTVTNSDGSTTIQNSDGTSYAIPQGIDPAIGKQLNENLARANQDAIDAKAKVTAATALYNSDASGTNPAAQAAAAQITQQFDVLIRQMQDKNKILLGSYAVNAARTGGLQYSNETNTNFMSAESDKAVARVGDLTDKMNAAILKSNAAYESGDLKALDSAMREYNDSKTQGQKALMDLQKTIAENVKQNAADLKQAQAVIKTTNDRDIKTSTALGNTMANDIKESGLTDPAQIDEYIQGMAEKYGITNPDILKSAFVKAQQAQSKADLAAKNTVDTIANRDKRTQIAAQKKSVGTTDAGYKFKTAVVTTLYGAGLNKSDVTILQQAIGKYGAQAVHDSPKTPAKVKSVLESEFGLDASASPAAAAPASSSAIPPGLSDGGANF